jgi:hypothetical protein
MINIINLSTNSSDPNDQNEKNYQALLSLIGQLNNGPLNPTKASPLLYDLWNTLIPVNLEVNPVYGGGTNTSFQNGTLTVQVDAAQFPGAADVNGANFAQTLNGWAEVIGHELAHVELPDANDDYITASDLGQAIAIGERNEGEAYTAEYVIAEQLSDTDNSINPPDHSPFAKLNNLFHALRAVTNQDSPIFLTLNTVGQLTGNQFYNDAVGTLDAPGSVSLATASLHSPSGNDLAFTYQDRWQDQWILRNVYNFQSGQPYSYGLTNFKHSSITVSERWPRNFGQGCKWISAGAI